MISGRWLKDRYDRNQNRNQTRNESPETDPEGEPHRIVEVAVVIKDASQPLDGDHPDLKLTLGMHIQLRSCPWAQPADPGGDREPAVPPNEAVDGPGLCCQSHHAPFPWPEPAGRGLCTGQFLKLRATDSHLAFGEIIWRGG